VRRGGAARVVAAAALLLAAPVAARPAGAQQVAARFEITVVGDSTFSFPIGTLQWVALKRRGIVVDPARRDALVARFRIQGVQDGVVAAVVTGQTARVTTQHVVVLEPPAPSRWYRRGTFWGGSALGLAVGAIVGGLLF
jgi:hypothetical protein